MLTYSADDPGSITSMAAITAGNRTFRQIRLDTNASKFIVDNSIVVDEPCSVR